MMLFPTYSCSHQAVVPLPFTSFLPKHFPYACGNCARTETEAQIKGIRAEYNREIAELDGRLKGGEKYLETHPNEFLLAAYKETQRQVAALAAERDEQIGKVVMEGGNWER
jgi:hypothetical protein